MTDNFPTTADFPALLAEIAEIIGIDAVLTLSAAKGGLIVYFPARVTADHWLAELLGLEKAQIICDHFKLSVPQRNESRVGWVGTKAVIPSAASLRREMLYRHSFRSGLSVKQTAIRVGVSERAVSYWRAKRRGQHQ